MKTTILAAVSLILAVTVLNAGPPEGYYRFPALSGNDLIFTSEGDLWIVNSSGGVAQRLTSNLGTEAYSAVSPDGKLVAFSAQYEGPTEVYTMPVGGGLPVRRTFDGENAVVVGWTPGGKIIYQSMHHSTLPNRQLFTVDLKTGSVEPIPLNQASDACFDQTEEALYFTRLPFQGSHTKRYKGGTAQNIWKYNFGQPEAIPLTADYAGTSKTPMCWNNRIYFASDRDGTMNLWSMDEEGKGLKQLTLHKGWDVKFPSLRDGKIVYQLGADIHLFDISSGVDHLVPITLSSDFDQSREKWVKKPIDYLTSTSLSQNGDRLALTARGQVFVAPAQQGRFVLATSKNGVRYRNARFMPDGKSLLALTDESGELEFCKIPASGVGSVLQLTHDGRVFRSQGIPSPDGKWIIYGDKNERLWLFNMEDNKTVEIDSSDISDFSDVSWSPDSKWLAYAAPTENMLQQVKLYGVKDKNHLTLTSDRVESYNPIWSTDGKWIYFLSDRFFQSLVGSPWGSNQPEPFFDKTTKIYSVSLKKSLRSPFLPANELSSVEPEKKDESKKKEEEKKPVEVSIDADGIQERTTEVPVPAGTYRNLSMNEKYLFWTESDISIGSKTKLAALEIKNTDISSKVVLEDVADYELSRDGKKLMVRKGNDFYVFDASATPPSDLSKSKLNLDNWMFTVNPRDEWRQMFIEAWRLERDYFYDPNLHGVDYKGLLERHLPLVDRVMDRDEFNDLVSGLVGELSALHTFVQGGDRRVNPDQITLASLGAELKRDEAGGGYIIQHIFLGDPNYPDVASPLVKPYLDIHEGDVIKSINGISTLSVTSPFLLLRNLAGQQALLTLHSASSGKDFDAIVNPISPSDASNLRYSDWEYSKRLAVEKAGKGDIGYVHLRAMGGGNYSEWVKNFYPVFNRKGLIIDVRHNRGGNIDSWILEKLMRKAWFYWKQRFTKPTWNMQYAFRGHMVVLCDEFTASDGEAFTEGFRRLGLGKVIGTRTWGGEVWLSFDNWLVDNGIASAAETGVYGPEGEWLIEGHGVDPDTVVDNLPRTTYDGNDAQLSAAVQYLQEQIRLHPVEVPPAPAFPKKFFDYK